MRSPDNRSYLLFSRFNCEGACSITRADGMFILLHQDATVDSMVVIIMHHVNAILTQQADTVVTFSCNIYDCLPRCEYTSKHVEDISRIVRGYVEAIRACVDLSIPA